MADISVTSSWGNALCPQPLSLPSSLPVVGRGGSHTAQLWHLSKPMTSLISFLIPFHFKHLSGLTSQVPLLQELGSHLCLSCCPILERGSKLLGDNDRPGSGANQFRTKFSSLSVPYHLWLPHLLRRNHRPSFPFLSIFSWTMWEQWKAMIWKAVWHCSHLPSSSCQIGLNKRSRANGR